MAHAHVWTGWVVHNAYQQKRQCLRCKVWQYRNYGVQPG